MTLKNSETFENLATTSAFSRVQILKLGGSRLEGARFRVYLRVKKPSPRALNSKQFQGVETIISEPQCLAVQLFGVSIGFELLFR